MSENQSVCKKCGAPILWVETKYGKKMTLNAMPTYGIQVKEGIGELIEVHSNHWATCRGKKGA